MSYKDEAKSAQSARNKRMGINEPMNRREGEMKRGEFKKGGHVKGKGMTNVHVNVMPKPDGLPGAPPGGMGAPPMGPPMAGPPGPPPPPPGGPPPGLGGMGGGMGGPPGGPPMMRARGGKIPHMTAGAESGPGRLQKIGKKP